MLGRVVRVLGEVVHPILVVAAPDQEVPTLPAYVEVVRDLEPGLGPLQGLWTGLQALGDRAEAAYLSSCDVPFLQASFVRRLIELLDDDAIVCPRVDGYLHPLAAVYRREVAEAAGRLVAARQLRPVFLFDQVKTRVVEREELVEVDPTLASLRNLNTPVDYEEALREIGEDK